MTQTTTISTKSIEMIADLSGQLQNKKRRLQVCFFNPPSGQDPIRRSRVTKPALKKITISRVAQFVLKIEIFTPTLKTRALVYYNASDVLAVGWAPGANSYSSELLRLPVSTSLV
jgi:hypothetical protein